MSDGRTDSAPSPAPGPRIHRRETAEVTGLVERARRGEGGALVVHGEAGIGKTVLLSAAAEEGEAAGVRVLRAAGAEFAMEMPFAALHRLCAPLLGLADRLPPAQRAAVLVALGLADGSAPDQFMVGLAVLGLLSEAGGERPVACVVDDAQWLDRGSAQVLAFVARRVGSDPVAMLFAVRDLADAPELGTLPRLAPAPLDDAEARALVAAAVRAPLDERVREQLIAEAGGNPLALLELPRTLGPAGLAVPLRRPAARVSELLERSFRDRLRALPEPSRLLLVLAAAEPLGDPLLLRYAARLSGIALSAAEAAESAGLLTVDARVRFRHPLVRSVAYRDASPADRRRAHHALARAIDPDRDPDRRAWHRAQAAEGPDEEVAAQLERSADRASRRGGLAAAAAFLERSTHLTPDPGRRAVRALSAAQAMHEAGASENTGPLLETAAAGPLDDLSRARLLQLRGRVAFALHRDDDAPALLLEAAARVAAHDTALARDTYLEGLWAATGAERNGDANSIRAAAAAARKGPAAPTPPRPSDLLLDGLALLFTDGPRAAAPTLRAAVDAFGDATDPRWLPVACRAAWDLWDHQALEDLSTRCVRLADESGALSLLPLALNFQAVAATYAGRFVDAAAMTERAHAITEATAGASAPYSAIVLAAHRGDREQTRLLSETSLRRAEAHGEGGFVTIIEYAAAVLHNGLGAFETALEPALQAAGRSLLFWSAAALPEVVEAAVRTGRTDLALPALDRLAELTGAAGGDWALGVLARCRALLADGPEADRLYTEALQRLGRTPVAVQLARTHLLYGEWLSAQGRSAEGRRHLRQASTMSQAMGADAFAARAGRALRALGERPVVPRPSVTADLTPQETHVARLVAGGATSKEVAARLFLSPRTVDAHLRNIFRKLGITSRRQLRELDLGRSLAGDPDGEAALR
ncbi:ATP-binding protein [Actinomadura kijaniata]|uniref:ATP-binding protein n=1 Tax=Actinomadura kijaniata TaxID=46161 RepID=UPI003F1A8F1E